MLNQITAITTRSVLGNTETGAAARHYIPDSIAADRYHAMDNLRACMMLLGVIFHACCSYATLRVAAWPYKDPDTSAGFNVPILLIHIFRMPIFFTMSGFFAALYLQRAGTKDFLRNRARRILLPFLVFWPMLFAVTQPGYGYAAYLTSHAPMRWLTWEYYTSGEIIPMIRTMHLWFLYYLLYFYVFFVASAAALRRYVPCRWRESVDARFRRSVRSAWRPIIFCLPTGIPLYFMRTATLETDAGFLVHPKNLVAFGIFFGFGCLLSAHADILPIFARDAWKQVAAALLLSPLYLLSIQRSLRMSPQQAKVPHWIAVATGAVVIWLFLFGIVGLFIRYLNRPKASLRYVADSSYWIYLVHLPLMVWIPVAIRPLPLPAIAKFSIVLTISILILLASYESFVRYTAIGRMLNGSRHHRPARRTDFGCKISECEVQTAD